MVIAHNRGARHQLIADILERLPVRSQQELLDLLAADGVEITQATLSRDLVELGAVKVRQGRRLVYALPGLGGDPTPRPAPEDAQLGARVRRACEQLLVAAEASGNLVVVRTPPGAANYLASMLDHAPELDVMGTVAGDDTVLLVTRAVDGGNDLARRLLELADPAAGEAATRVRR